MLFCECTFQVENLRHVKARKIEYETSKKLLDERNRVLNGLKNKLIDLKEATAMKAKHLEEIVNFEAHNSKILNLF